MFFFIIISVNNFNYYEFFV